MKQETIRVSYYGLNRNQWTIQNMRGAIPIFDPIRCKLLLPVCIMIVIWCRKRSDSQQTESNRSSIVRSLIAKIFNLFYYHVLYLVVKDGDEFETILCFLFNLCNFNKCENILQNSRQLYWKNSFFKKFSYENSMFTK